MGTLIGSYTVVAPLAAGGKSDIVLAKRAGGDAYVVLKWIRPEYAADPLALGMYLGAVRTAAAALSHKQIVQVHEVVQTEHEAAIAMEYIHGVDLRSLLASASRRGERMPLDYAIAIAAAVASGLHYAHERRSSTKKSLGILHRNLAPSNILIGYDGTIKCTDFGALRRTPGGDGPAEPPGRASYLSPEQCLGGEVDRRSDVYALGVVLYELATTTRLFVGGDDEVIEQIVQGRVEPPSLRRGNLPAELSAIILRAIARDPDERYATCNELRVALDQIAGRTVRATPVAIAGYVHDQLGARPEPWLSLGAASPEATVRVTTNTWTQTPHGDEDARSVSRLIPIDGLPETTASARRSTGAIVGEVEPAAPYPSEVGSARAASPTAAPEPLPDARRAPPRKSRSAAVYGAPLLLIAGIAVWRFAGSGGSSARAPDARSGAQGAAAQGGVPAEPLAAVAPAAATPPTAEPAPSPPPPLAADPAPSAPGATERVVPAAAAPARSAAHTEPAMTAKSHGAPAHRAAPRSAEIAAAAPSPHIPTPEPAPVAPPPPAPVVPAPVASPPVVAVAPIARAAPAPPPPSPPAVLTVAPTALDANRLAGARDISPDTTTELKIKQAGKDKVSSAYQLCVGPDGLVATVAQIKSTGFAAFDAKIEATIREKWRYRPFLVNGRPATACSKVGFVYWPKVL